MKYYLINNKILVLNLLLVTILLILALIAISIPKTYALLDPAAAYCQACGYNYSVEETALGEEGFCTLPNNEKVDAWDFLTGKTALEWSYCSTHGYGAKHVEDTDTCMDCCMCVLPNGSEVEVIEFMKLDLSETTCGDDVCGLPENYLTCPEDCSSGSSDEYCDSIADDICDPDCTTDTDPDCAASPVDQHSKSSTNWQLIGGIVGGVLLFLGIVVAIYFRNRREKTSKKKRRPNQRPVNRPRLSPDDWEDW